MTDDVKTEIIKPEYIASGGEMDNCEIISKPDIKHIKKQQLTCDPCSATFSKAGYLKKHSRVHSVERPYTCDNKTYSKT